MPFLIPAIGAAVGVWVSMAAIGMFAKRKQQRDAAEAKVKVEAAMASLLRVGRDSNQEMN